MKKNINSLLGLATTGLLLASSVGHAADAMKKEAPKADPKATEKATGEASQCSGPNGCDGKTVKCTNTCKGHNDCKGANNSCKGHAECKGKSWVHAAKDGACPKGTTKL